MADASKLKGLRRLGLGAPPLPDEARTDLVPAPAPDPPTHVAGPGATVPANPGGHPTREETRRNLPVEAPRAGRIDGRTLRQSGRTVQFATRVSPEFDERVRRIVMRDGLLLVEVLERALDAYEHSSKEEDR